MSYKTFGITLLFQFQRVQKKGNRSNVCNIYLLVSSKWMYRLHKILLDMQAIYVYKVKKKMDVQVLQNFICLLT